MTKQGVIVVGEDVRSMLAPFDCLLEVPSQTVECSCRRVQLRDGHYAWKPEPDSVCLDCSGSGVEEETWNFGCEWDYYQPTEGAFEYVRGHGPVVPNGGWEVLFSPNNLPIEPLGEDFRGFDRARKSDLRWRQLGYRDLVHDGVWYQSEPSPGADWFPPSARVAPHEFGVSVPDVIASLAPGAMLTGLFFHS